MMWLALGAFYGDGYRHICASFDLPKHGIRTPCIHSLAYTPWSIIEFALLGDQFGGFCGEILDVVIQ
jgi:hypothetical protein